MPEHEQIAPDSMTKLNEIGQALANIEGVKAMTDVTGFGLLGHLIEMCEGSKLSAKIEFDKIPIFKGVNRYIKQDCIPGGTHRNWESYGHHVQLKEESNKAILCDPQTSGGLLIAVEDNAINEVEKLLTDNNVDTVLFGNLHEGSEAMIKVV